MIDQNVILPLSIKVKLHAGTSILEASKGLVHVANTLNCGVDADFNGVTLMAFPEDDAVRLAEDFQRELKSKSKHKVAMDRGAP